MSSNRKSKATKPKNRAKPTIAKGNARRASASQSATPSAPESSSVPPKALSGLGAAALVLREAAEPLNAQDLVKRIIDQGLWKTEGKTPAATIYAAMIREIKVKGSSSRFRKVERGRFAATG
jgi:hypothetical protein